MFQCEKYPVLNYTLEVQSSSNSVVITHPIVPQHSKLIGSLSENREYALKILAANTVGIVSSTSRQLCELSITYYRCRSDMGTPVMWACTPPPPVPKSRVK